MRMVESGQELRFPLEAVEPFRISGHFGREYLDRDFTAEVGVGGAIDGTHPTGPDRRGDPVMRQRSTDQRNLPAGKYPPGLLKLICISEPEKTCAERYRTANRRVKGQTAARLVRSRIRERSTAKPRRREIAK